MRGAITSNDSQFHGGISFAIAFRRAENGGRKDRAEERECKDENSVGQTASRDLEQQTTGDDLDETHLDCSSDDIGVGRHFGRERQLLRSLQLQLLPGTRMSADVLLHGVSRRTPDVLSHGVRHGLRAAAVHRQSDLL